MSGFQFRLESLLKLRETHRHQCRLGLAEAQHADQLLQKQEDDLAQDLYAVTQKSRISASPGHVNVDNLRDAHRYRLVLEAQQAIVQQRRQQVAGEIQKRRETLAEADKQVRVLERLRERQQREYAEAEARRLQTELDEMAVQQWNGRARVSEAK